MPRSRLILILTPILTILLWGTAAGQWMLQPPPADSPYWWTLTEGITPAELRATLQSRKASRERLERAIEHGEYPAQPERRLREISLFVDGVRDPDLFPMWDAFRMFSLRVIDHETDREQQAREAMPKYGIAPESVETILTAALNADELASGIQKDIFEQQMEFATRILDPAEKRLGRDRAAEMIIRRDIAVLALESGLGRDQVSDLYQTWIRDSWADVCTDTLEGLRATLPESEWEGFRRFLLEKVAATMDYAYFNPRPLR